MDSIIYTVGFYLIIFLVFLYVDKNKNKNGSSAHINNSVINKLHKALDNNEFTNKRVMAITTHYRLLTADTHGENYIFAVPNGPSKLTLPNIQAIHETAQKAHIHNVVLINPLFSPYPNQLLQSICKLGIEVWDLNKLNSLAKITPTSPISSTATNELNKESPPVTKSILKTSNTSDDKCVIDTNSTDPIQDLSDKKLPFFSQIFKKPDRL